MAIINNINLNGTSYDIREKFSISSKTSVGTLDTNNNFIEVIVPNGTTTQSFSLAKEDNSENSDNTGKTIVIINNTNNTSDIIITFNPNQYHLLNGLSTYTIYSGNYGLIEAYFNESTFFIKTLEQKKTLTEYLCRLTLSDGAILDIEGTGVLNTSDISGVKSVITSIETGLNCTEIGNSTFNLCSTITSAYIGNTVTTLAYRAFNSCFYLNTISIAAPLTTLGFQALASCSSLVTVNIPETVSTISDQVFANCSKLKYIKLPNKISTLNGHLFEGCRQLSNIVIPSTITSINMGAFKGCTSLLNIVSLAPTPPTLGTDVFYNLPQYGNVYVPGGATAYNAWLHDLPGGWSIQEIDTSFCVMCYTDGTVSSIHGTGTLKATDVSSYKSTLSSVYLGTSCTAIESYAFDGFTQLKFVDIPNTITTLYSRCFNNCTNLLSIYISASVSVISTCICSGCTSLENIIVDSNNTVYDSRNNCNAIILTSQNKLMQGCKNTIIPDTVTSIADYAFSSHNGFTSIDIPNSVTTIDNNAFTNCPGLTYVTIGNSISSIGSYAFSYCSMLKTIKCFKNTAPSLGTDVFIYIQTNGILYVPKNATGYNTWINQLPSGWTINYSL